MFDTLKHIRVKKSHNTALFPFCIIFIYKKPRHIHLEAILVLFSEVSDFNNINWFNIISTLIINVKYRFDIDSTLKDHSHQQSHFNFI